MTSNEVLLTGFLESDIQNLVNSKMPVVWDLPNGVFLGPLGGGMKAQVVFMPKSEVSEEKKKILDKLYACLKSHYGKNSENGTRTFPSIWFDERESREIMVVDNPMYFSQEVRDEISASIA